MKDNEVLLEKLQNDYNFVSQGGVLRSLQVHLFFVRTRGLFLLEI